MKAITICEFTPFFLVPKPQNQNAWKENNTNKMHKWTSNKMKIIVGEQTGWLSFTFWHLFAISGGNILLPCLSLLHRGFFPQCKTTSCVKRTRVRILLITVCTTWLSHSKNCSGPLRLQNRLVKVIRNVAYAVRPDAPGEEMLAGSSSRWRSWRWWLI